MDITITIVNYDKYKGRKDVENNSWFRLSNRFLEDADFFDFSAEEKLVWIYLLSVASQKNTAKLRVNHRHAEQVCGLPSPSINSAIKKLSEIGVLKIEQARTLRGRYVDDTATCATDRQTDITNKTDTATAPPSPSENPVGYYCEKYKVRYGHNPVIGKKQAGIISRFAKNHPARWRDLISGYLEMPDSWAVARSHPVEILEQKINEIVRYLETGKVVTKKVIEHAEEIIDKAQGTNRRPRRPIAELEQEQAAMRAEAQLQIVGGKP